jgi:hypothetical protein
MTGEDADTPADQLDRRTLMDIDLPTDPAQKRRDEQAGDRPTDDDSSSDASRLHTSLTLAVRSYPAQHT